MTPGERRRRDNRYHRKEAWSEIKEYRRNLDSIPDLHELPHPKIAGLTAYHYVSWLADHGYASKAITYLKSL